MLRKLKESRFFVIGILLILLACSKDKVQRGISYYKNGQLKHEVLLNNGKPEGLGMTYYESGKVLSKTNWKDGKEHGRNTSSMKTKAYAKKICVNMEFA